METSKKRRNTHPILPRHARLCQIGQTCYHHPISTAAPDLGIDVRK